MVKIKKIIATLLKKFKYKPIKFIPPFTPLVGNHIHKDATKDTG